MRKASLVLVTVAGVLAFAGTALADTTEAGSCGDVHWKSDVLLKYPDIAKSCVAVVDRDGKKYVKLSGKVRSKGKDTVTVLLDHTNTDMTWKPTAGEMVSIEGKDIPAMKVMVDQKLRFYMPIDQVATM